MNTTPADETILNMDVLGRVERRKERREQLLDEVEQSGHRFPRIIWHTIDGSFLYSACIRGYPCVSVVKNTFSEPSPGKMQGTVQFRRKLYKNNMLRKHRAKKSKKISLTMGGQIPPKTARQNIKNKEIFAAIRPVRPICPFASQEYGAGSIIACPPAASAKHHASRYFHFASALICRFNHVP